VGAAAVVFRFGLALVFLLSGLAKLPRRSEFTRAVRNYRLVPEGVGELIGKTLPPVEVLAGALLALGLGVRPVAILLAVFLVAFSAAVAINLLRGRTIDCGCFGPVANRQITWWTVARNLVLTAAAIVVAAIQPTALALDRFLPGTPKPDMASGSAVALFFATTLLVVTASLVQDWRRVARLVAAAPKEGS
jgi:uncharacterized membrane protein YphA (DoxX/SURF4 family)